MKNTVLLLVGAMALTRCAAATFQKTVYLDAMETAARAYGDEAVVAYADEADRLGVQEHGFPRLASNLGILLAHGRMTGRRAVVKRMLDICFRDVVKAMPPKSGGNDFSVKELVFALQELERAGTFDREVTEAWRRRLTAAEARRIYSSQPPVGNAERAFNWCVFGVASEQARIAAGAGGDPAYVEKYVSDQIRWFDENGMYMDPGMPMVYDMVTRLQFAAVLGLGYSGPCREALESQMLKSAEPTLAMQSVAGEIPYGGRSNQFLHNDTFYAALCEWYAGVFRRRGDLATARRFRGAAKRAMASLARWTAEKPIRHVKNRYPTETGYGCERYAYFNKYMITMGSWSYLAYLFADDSIEPDETVRDSSFTMSGAFHRAVVNRGGYTVEWDWDGQAGYDATGVGRIQRLGAPPVICLSTPCPVEAHYRMDVTNDRPFAIAAADGRLVKPERIGEDGVVFRLTGKGEQRLMLPALVTDGERRSVTTLTDHVLEIAFRGWVCRYWTNGGFQDTNRVYGNRNGHYRRFDAYACDNLEVRVTITPAKDE